MTAPSACRAALSRSLLLAGLLAAVAAPAAHAQGFLNKLKQRAQQKVDQATDRAAQKVVDGAADIIVRCATGDQGCIDRAGAAGKTVVTSTGDTIRPPASSTTDASADATPPADSKATVGGPAPSTGGAPGTGVWVNWDFKPGNRPIFVDDFTHDEVGDFPRRLQLLEGNFEVADVGGRRLLRTTSQGAFSINLPENLPERFTLEFDMMASSGWLYLTTDPRQPNSYDKPGSDHTYMEISYTLNRGGLVGGGIDSKSPGSHDLRKVLYTVRLMVDGPYAKMYMDDKRVANAPVTKIPRSGRISFNTYTSNDEPVYFGNIRIAAGGKKLYDALLADGRVATQGIYFDTGSDKLRGESSATLKEIAAVLTEHPDLKLTIEGHTDNVGAAAANQSLSERRAAAVRAALTSTYGIDAARLTSKGFGASKPVAPNTTDEGRQQNRRVELVKN